MRVFKSLKSYAKTVVWVAKILVTQGWQLAGVVVIAFYNHRPWECLFLLIGFWIGRRFFGTTYHAPTMIACTAITWIIFYFLTSGVPSFYMSYTVPCLLGITLAFTLSTISELIERR